MAKLPFWKLQSVGNDFPLVHLEDVAALNPAADLDGQLTSLAIAMCDRHTGIGGDGLLAVGMELDALRLRMFNPDGTEDFCGNGIRCAAVHANHLGWVGSRFEVKHLNRSVATVIDEGRVHTTLGMADYEPDHVPHRRYGEIFNANVWDGMDAGHPLSLFGSALTTGSTHVVIPTTSLPDQESFESVSAKIERDPLYPKRTSVIWVQEIEPRLLKLLIWERGVGETLGCGTGATAAAADYMRRKGIGGDVQVQSKGGVLTVSATKWHAPLTISGTATEVFRGTYLTP